MTYDISEMKLITKRLNNVVVNKRSLNDLYDLQTNLYRKKDVNKMPEKFVPQILSDEEIDKKVKEFEELMKNGGEGFKLKFKKFFDINQDGAVNRKDIYSFLIQLITILAVVYGFLLYLYWDQILQMIMTKSIDEVFLKQIFLSTAISMVVAFLRQKYSKENIRKEKELNESKKIIESIQNDLKQTEDEKRQMQLKFELEQYRAQVQFELEKLQLSTDKDIQIAVKDAIARLECAYNDKLKSLLNITNTDANAILDNAIQNLPNVEKSGVVNSIVEEQKQETSALRSEMVPSVSEVRPTDQSSETLNKTTNP